jgi:hypothetical protein
MPETYYYHGDSATDHPVLGRLEPGANEIPDEHHDLAEECVAQGLLSHDAEAPAAEEPAPAEPEGEGEPGGQEPEA